MDGVGARKGQLQGMQQRRGHQPREQGPLQGPTVDSPMAGGAGGV